MNDFQTMGSGITYFRRYALSSSLGIVTDKDTDAAGEKDKPQIKESKLPSFVKKHTALVDLTLAIDLCETFKRVKPIALFE